MELQDNFGPSRFEDSPFGFVRKVQQRYSFTPKQKEVLMKHFNMHGMTGQSQAYHEKIMTCAREADVDFDIVRNWIGNVRRKKRLEATRYPGSNGLYIMDGSGSGSEPKIPRMEGPHYGFSRTPPSVPTTLARQPTSIMHPIASLSLQPPPFSMESVMAEMQTGMGPGGQASQPPTAAGEQSTSSSSKPQPVLATIPKVEGGQQSSCALSGQLPPPNTSASTTGPPLPMDRSPMALQEHQMKELEIRRTMGSIQQSMHYLERLGCETIVVSHYQGKTFVSGTERGVNYFAEMQEIRPISEHLRPVGINSSVFSTSGTTDNSNSAPDDATTSSQEQKGDRGRNGQGGDERQGGKATEKTNRDDKSDDKDFEQSDNDDDEDEEEEEESDEKRDTSIRSGQEVYIVDKNHFVIGVGNILPAPHQRITLKNAPPPEDYFD